MAAQESLLRAPSLKFRDCPELLEFNSNLTSSMAFWLASALHLEDGITPITADAQRLGLTLAAKLNNLHDGLVQCLYQSSEEAVLQAACHNGSVSYKKHKIIVPLTWHLISYSNSSCLKLPQITSKPRTFASNWLLFPAS